MDRRNFLTGLASIVPYQAFSESDATGNRPEAAAVRLQGLMDNYVGSRRLAGAVAAVTHHRAATHYVQAGNLSLESAARFNRDSICRIYSMTKPVTGCAAMLLIQDGKMRLDQPVADFIPEFAKLEVAIDPSSELEARPATGMMTIRHLLTHSAGLAYWTPGAGTDALSTAYRAKGITPGNFYPSGLTRPGYGPQAVGLDDMVKRLAELPLAAEPGTIWRYSVGLDVMGLVIERASGSRLDVFARERIFAPLRMESTGFEVPAARSAQLTSNYTVTGTGLVPLDPRKTSVFLRPPMLLAGGAGLVSTARDFTRFGAMLLGDGLLRGVRVMEPQTARQARTNLLPSAVSYDGGGFGAGMRVATRSTPRETLGAVSWNGAAGTMWLLDPSRMLNFVFLSQFMPPTAYKIWDEVGTALDGVKSSG